MNFKGILILEDDLVILNLEMLVLIIFYIFLFRYSWYKLFYLLCKDWLRNIMVIMGYIIIGYFIEIIGVLVLIFINKIIVLYIDFFILVWVWFVFVFFYIFYCWYSRFRWFFNVIVRYFFISVVIFWEKLKDGVK